MSKNISQRADRQSSAPVRDARFASFESNPRYKLPSKKHSKTTVDKRFARMLKDDEFTTSAKVDKYGRKVKSDSKKKALQRLYKDEDEDEDEDEDDGDIDDDDVVQRELEKANANYDPARGGGFSSSDSESDTDSEGEEEEEENADTEADTSASVNRLRDAQADVETGDVTKRIAIVNLDWDHIKSADLMALFSSFAPKGGRIERVSIYPSEFGKERMQREELEGPPKEIFKKQKQDEDEDEDKEDSEIDSEEDNDSDSDSDSDSDEDEKIKKGIIKEGDDQDFDSDALRSYQLDRLRYYYAVMVCSDTATAEKIYQATDGTEYQTSSNFIDLRFVPDEVEFDDEPRDECNKVSGDYKPTDFVTDALQHSKVKLTWDMHPEEAARREDIKRAFSGSRSELQENDLRAYLASDSEDEPEPQDATQGEDGEPALSKKELKAQKMRALLGLGSETTSKSSKSGPVGDMQITFTPGLMDNGPKKKEAGGEEATTIEKYKRKEKERKVKKKEKALAKRNGIDPDADEDEGDEVIVQEDGDDDLGFDDPFFTTDEPTKVSKASQRKEERLKKREAKEAAAAENAAEKAKLEQIMAEDRDEDDERLDHFNIKEIARAEKLKGKKNKKNKKSSKASAENEEGLQDGFSMDVADDRFGAVFGDHKFAIDPSHPQYKATPGMKALLEEGRKKRKNAEDEPPVEVSGDRSKKKQKMGKQANDDLASLVESVRRKANSKR